MGVVERERERKSIIFPQRKNMRVIFFPFIFVFFFGIAR